MKVRKIRGTGCTGDCLLNIMVNEKISRRRYIAATLWVLSMILMTISLGESVRMLSSSVAGILRIIGAVLLFAAVEFTPKGNSLFEIHKSIFSAIVNTYKRKIEK